MIAALFVEENGPYINIEGVDPWTKCRDARDYDGPHPVIAHPPCQRWGRYWSGGPSAKTRRFMGDDKGCFWAALSSVRQFGGVLEHPEASYAFKLFGLPIPEWNGGWTDVDQYGGRACCVAQGHYGHKAQKMTWLYAVRTAYPELIWGPCKNKVRMDLGFHSSEERKRAPKTEIPERLTQRQRLLTPEPFRDLLISIAASSPVK